MDRSIRSLSERIINQLSAVGINGVLVNAATENRPDVDFAEKCDGILLLGGSDVDPAKYGQEVDAQAGVYGLIPDADDFEIALVRKSIGLGLPLLGICRGMQVLNVALGGTLLQDIGLGTMHNLPGFNAEMVSHPVRLAANTKLSSIYETEEIVIRSGHHQAVRTVGTGLHVCATASDGTVEAIELAGESWTVGVQWHPEDHYANAAHFFALFQAFADQCERYAKTKNTVQSVSN
ncbi:gamma-glutamyl-gamma-aminobutyrate hydrolase family protein [Paraburkholderia sp. CNPSo 3281]|uniref:gamma-glutamyl-gamma-aminobutyrate hydrolase family protein n=1 Tax=Paraburkholderia sp. CNPSo 3281 TaxID=2940933 RepID=UPI0020B75A9D|nr:gamma-glutamyl-gamma-aminobutyrate hydrolase family protein [Paraburkholderia sp. CNPSo 3281]MCP3721001.1 gamma-glutamyl-gamma-aminobutyrate hydrolase family protein [Paraburkholderia sp. CNPSo 3281]